MSGVVTDVINFRERKLEYYKGNFDEYENLLKAKLAEQRKLWEKEQKMLKELQKKQTPGKRVLSTKCSQCRCLEQTRSDEEGWLNGRA